jgi:hypothetical protein
VFQIFCLKKLRALKKYFFFSINDSHKFYARE